MSVYKNNRKQNIYETGRTQPPKKHGGFVALLLIILIFVGGIYSAMTSLNLAPRQEKKEEIGLLFSSNNDGQVATEEIEEKSVFSCDAAGISGEFLSSLDQQLGHLPGGLYVTHIVAGSDAEAKGIRPGDILLKLDDVAISDQASVETALCDRPAGETVRIALLRDGKEQSVDLILSEESDK